MNHDDPTPKRPVGRPRTNFAPPKPKAPRKSRKKIKPGKLAHVTLISGPKRGYGHDIHKNRWYVSYLEKGEISREYLPTGATEADAVEERDRRYMELAMLGAKVMGASEEVPTPAPPPDPKEPNFGITIGRRVMTVLTYRVVLKKKFYGEFKSIREARECRDRALEELRLKPCAVCGAKPVHAKVSRHYRWQLSHECPSGNSVVIKRIPREKQEALWNEKLCKGVKP